MELYTACEMHKLSLKWSNRTAVMDILIRRTHVMVLLILWSNNALYLP